MEKELKTVFTNVLAQSHNAIDSLGVLYIKTIQVAYSWDCIMLQ